MNKKEKVIIALSGGVDSAVSAALLVKEGFAVTAAYMVNYDNEAESVRDSCWINEYRDAVRVAAALSIPIVKWDFTAEYKKEVLDHMFAEYRKGNTPNPDVLCNKYIKFGAWLRKAEKLGFDYLATGHYARLGVEGKTKNEKRTNDSKFKIPNLSSQIALVQAKDLNKDQTYFLHQLNQDQLRRVLFPIGEYTKPEVRALAKKFKLPVAEKEESMGICFVGEVPMKDFLLKKIKPTPGPISTSAGVLVGMHDGLPFYTIGQRHLGALQPAQSVGEKQKKNSNVDTKPWYVVAKNNQTNELIVGHDDDALLYTKEHVVDQVNWISGKSPQFPFDCQVRLRHRQPLQNACIISKKEGIVVSFSEPQRAVTPGQWVVFYNATDCLGGGVIV